MDGVSMLPLLENRKGQKEHEFLYFEFQELNGRQAVRKGPWKLVHMNIRGDKPIMNCITWRPTRRNGTIYWTSILKK